MFNVKSMGPSTEPCGTPWFTVAYEDDCSFTSKLGIYLIGVIETSCILVSHCQAQVSVPRTEASASSEAKRKPKANTVSVLCVPLFCVLCLRT